MSLSEKQINAAHRLGQDVCVVAGPGSGKTSVLIERFSWLVREKGIEPNRILAITFTEKAATEIKQRLVGAFANDHELRENIERAYVSTIDAFCTRLLKENAIEAGIDPRFEIADETVGLELKREAADEVLEAIFTATPDRMRRFLDSLAVSTQRDGRTQDLAQSLTDIYEAMRVAGADVDDAGRAAQSAEFTSQRLKMLLREMLAEGIKGNTVVQREEHGRFNEWAGEVLDLPVKPTVRHFELLNVAKFYKNRLVKTSKVWEGRDQIEALLVQLRKELLPIYYSEERELIKEALREIDTQFRAKKTALSLLDFADLESYAIDLLESDPDLCQRIGSKFDYILMDELQDTNPLQWRLLNLLRRPGRFFAVGDINQSIFGFRHAEPELFRGYQQTILDASQTVDELLDNYRSRGEVLASVNHVFDNGYPGIAPHKLIGARQFPVKNMPSVELMAGVAELTDDAAQIEALWVAKRITELVDPARFSDVAILTRTNAGMTPIQKALEQFGIPSIVVGGRTFFEAREVRDLILLLRTIVNPCDEIALAGVLRSPLAGVSDESLWRLRQKGSLRNAFAMGDPELEPFRTELTEIRSMREALSPDRLLRRVIDASDYESTLTDQGRANVEKFLSLIRAEFRGSVEKLLEKLANRTLEAEAPPNDFGNAVRLMSIHQSKGLEFPIVFLPALHKGTGNTLPVITYRAGIGLGVKWRDPASRTGEGDAAYCAIDADQKAKEGEEGDRLLYVAMTRAKEHLILSFARGARSYRGWAPLVCSRFGVDSGVADNQVKVVNDARVFIADEPPEIVPVEATAIQSTQPQILQTFVAEDQFDSSAPVTAVSLFAACPRKYFLSRYLRWDPRNPAVFDAEEEVETPDAGELDASEFGLQVHSILAGAQAPNPDPAAVALARNFHTSVLGQQAAEAETVYKEYDFLMEVHSMVLRGQMDLWFERQGKITVVDYKTDQVKLPVDPARLNSYALQLRIYAMAIEKLTGRLPDQAWLYFLRPNQPIEIDLSPKHLEQARKAVLDLRSAQDAGLFPLREGPQCKRCDFYRGLCPAGKGIKEGANSGTYQIPFSFAAPP